VSRFLLPTFLCGWQRKVGAPPHRGNANKPITKQGKAKKTSKERPKIQSKERQKNQTKKKPKK
jgi:general secretion pathway protein K